MKLQLQLSISYTFRDGSGRENCQHKNRSKATTGYANTTAPHYLEIYLAEI